jgi:hypothetical protein
MGFERMHRAQRLLESLVTVSAIVKTVLLMAVTLDVPSQCQY